MTSRTPRIRPVVDRCRRAAPRLRDPGKVLVGEDLHRVVEGKGRARRGGAGDALAPPCPWDDVDRLGPAAQSRCALDPEKATRVVGRGDVSGATSSRIAPAARDASASGASIRGGADGRANGAHGRGDRHSRGPDGRGHRGPDCAGRACHHRAHPAAGGGDAAAHRPGSRDDDATHGRPDRSDDGPHGARHAREAAPDGTDDVTGAVSGRSPGSGDTSADGRERAHTHRAARVTRAQATAAVDHTRLATRAMPRPRTRAARATSRAILRGAGPGRWRRRGAGRRCGRGEVGRRATGRDRRRRGRVRSRAAPAGPDRPVAGPDRPVSGRRGRRARTSTSTSTSSEHPATDGAQQLKQPRRGDADTGPPR